MAMYLDSEVHDMTQLKASVQGVTFLTMVTHCNGWWCRGQNLKVPVKNREWRCVSLWFSLSFTVTLDLTWGNSRNRMRCCYPAVLCCWHSGGLWLWVGGSCNGLCLLMLGWLLLAHLCTRWRVWPAQPLFADPLDILHGLPEIWVGGGTCPHVAPLTCCLWIARCYWAMNSGPHETCTLDF